MKDLKSCCGNHVIKVTLTAIATIAFLMFAHKRQKKYLLWKKSMCFNLKHDAPAQLKLQQLDEEDDPEERSDILEMKAISLIDAAKEGKISPLKIIRSFLYQACLVNNDLNCITGLIKDAEYFSNHLLDRPVGDLKLFCVPVSLKENLETKGMDCTCGLLHCLNDPALTDAVLVEVLKHCGAIPFVKTNLSHMSCSFESSNPLFGVTLHPQNKDFTPGGSSSGEGALIAAGGSILGFGTDFIGDIRCPSHLCGIAGFLPSRNRISSKGLKGIKAQIGPMAKEVEMLALAMDSLLCPLMFRLDPSVPPIPFHYDVYESQVPLRIGYYDDDGYLLPIHAVRRSVKMARTVLSDMGHTLVPFQVPDVARAMHIHSEKVHGILACHILETFENECADRILNDLISKFSMSAPLRWLKSWLLSFKSRRLGDDLRSHRQINSIAHLRLIEEEIRSYQHEFLDCWVKQDIQALICPPFPVVAGPLGSLTDSAGLWSYTALYNLLGYPAGVVPVTKVNESDMNALKTYKGHYDDDWDRHIKKMCGSSLGMPVGVQCVSLPFKDEVCLRVMRDIEKAVDYDEA